MELSRGIVLHCTSVAASCRTQELVNSTYALSSRAKRVGAERVSVSRETCCCGRTEKQVPRLALVSPGSTRAALGMTDVEEVGQVGCHARDEASPSCHSGSAGYFRAHGSAAKLTR